MKPALLVLTGIALGCSAAAVTRLSANRPARAANAAVEQYCTTSGDYNNIKAVNTLVKQAGERGWELIGVYRPHHLGASYEDYVCFRRAPE
jgi:hypothetical protein